MGKPRVVQRFVTQPPVDTITLNVDSDHEREFTGYHVTHVTQAASTTKTVIALSSAGALRDQAWFGRDGRHEELSQRLRKSWRQIRCQNVACRNGWVRGRCDTWTLSGCWCTDLPQAECNDSENPRGQH